MTKDTELIRKEKLQQGSPTKDLVNLIPGYIFIGSCSKQVKGIAWDTSYILKCRSWISVRK